MKPKPLTIVWLCTFTNAEKKSHLPLWRDRQDEIGQWIPNLLQGFTGDPLFQIHVISAEAWMRKRCVSWVKDGVHYHCVQAGIPGLGYSFRLPVEAWTGYRLNRMQICRLIGEIKPDLVHLFGVENPQYGAAALDLAPALPLLVTIQGFVHRQRQYHGDYYMRSRCLYEERLLKHCRHFTGDYESEQVVRTLNPQIDWHHLYFPVNERLIEVTPVLDKRYDILFAGGLTKAKGFNDFLEIVRLLQKERPDIQAGVVGNAETFADAIPFLNRHGLNRYVSWLGRFPDQAELFRVFRQARLFLTPTYNDAFASTIRECMLLGVPVISYRTGGIPYANRDGGENVVIVEQGDVRGMALRALDLLCNADGREAMAARAMQFARSEFSLARNAGVIKAEYERLASKASRNASE